jgi:hypothetical protein
MHRSDYRLIRALLTLQTERATGTLRVDAEGVLTAIRLRDGRPVFVEGGLPADSLGRLLVAHGKLDEAELARVEEQRMVMQGRQRFGEAAKHLGLIADEELAQAVREQVRVKLARCLHWERSQHLFQAEEHSSPELEGAPIDVEPVLLSGIARHYSLERVQDVLVPSWHEAAELRAEAALICARFALDAKDEQLLADVLRAPSVGHILCEQGYRNPRIGHLLATLALTDQLRMPEPEIPEESGRFIIDNLERTPRSSSRAPTAGQPAPGPPGSVARLETRRRSTPPIQDQQLPGKDKLLADSAFLQGRELLRAGEYGAAADAFREAANLRPGAREYALFAAWSAYLSTGRDQKWREMLVELCEKTLDQDRLLAFAHHVRGQLALEVRDLDTARVAFSRAVQLDPTDEEAKALLAGITQ